MLLIPVRPIAISILAFVVMLGAAASRDLMEDGDLLVGSYFTLTKDELSLLAADKPVVRVSRDRHGDAAALVFGSIEINAPRSIIWDIMLDCNHAPDLVPRLKSCEVVENGPDGRWDIREHRIDSGFIFSDIVNIFRSDYIPSREIRFHLVGGDLKTQEGAWQLEAASIDESRTRVIYQARLAIGQPVPRFLIRRSVRNDLPRIFQALKEMSEIATQSVDADQTR